MMSLPSFSLLFLFFLLLSLPSSLGKDLFVSPSSMGGDGTEGKPFSNFQDAFSAAGDGDRIIAEEGIYPSKDNTNLKMIYKKKTKIDFLTKSGVSSVKIDMSESNGFAWLISANDSKVSIDSYNFTGQQKGNILDFEQGGDLELKNTQFWSNIVEDGHCVSSTESLSIINSLFVGNGKGISSQGPAIYSNGDLFIFNSSFEFNNAVDNGGAIYASGESTTIFHSLFARNNAGGRGGGIFLSNVLSFYMKDSYITRNQAGKLGGGIAVLNNVLLQATTTTTTSNITNTKITYNKCTTQTKKERKEQKGEEEEEEKKGGGMYLESTLPFSFSSVIFEGNEVREEEEKKEGETQREGKEEKEKEEEKEEEEEGEGGGLYVLETVVKFFDVEWTMNVVEGNGGGLAIINSDSPDLEMIATKFYNNSATNNGGGSYFENSYFPVGGDYQNNTANYGGGTALKNSIMFEQSGGNNDNNENNINQFIENSAATHGTAIALLEGTSGILSNLTFQNYLVLDLSATIYANSTSSINISYCDVISATAFFYGDGPHTSEADSITFIQLQRKSTQQIIGNNRMVFNYIIDSNIYGGASFNLTNSSFLLCTDGPIRYPTRTNDLVDNSLQIHSGSQFSTNWDNEFGWMNLTSGSMTFSQNDCAIYGYSDEEFIPKILPHYAHVRGHITALNLSWNFNQDCTLEVTENSIFDVSKIEGFGGSIKFYENSVVSASTLYLTGYNSASSDLYFEDGVTIDGDLYLDQHAVTNFNFFSTNPVNVEGRVQFGGHVNYSVPSDCILMKYQTHSGEFISNHYHKTKLVYNEHDLSLTYFFHPFKGFKKWEIIIFSIGLASLVAFLVVYCWWYYKKTHPHHYEIPM